MMSWGQRHTLAALIGSLVFTITSSFSPSILKRSCEPCRKYRTHERVSHARGCSQPTTMVASVPKVANVPPTTTAANGAASTKGRLHVQVWLKLSRCSGVRDTGLINRIKYMYRCAHQTRLLPLKLKIKLGDAFYDLTGWRKIHPAGRHWIDRFADQDATDVMTAFHSEEAFERLKTLPVVRNREPIEPNQRTKNFRAFRQELVEGGWFKRVWYKDAFFLAAHLATHVAGMMVSRVNPWLGIVVLGLAHTTGGWFAHDMVHGRGRFCNALRNYGALTCGLSTKWWSEKHNIHHAFTNVVGTDEDLMVEPFVWLWAPNEERDRPWRRFQKFYWPFVFSLTFLQWRIDSVRTVLARKLKAEGVCLALHYSLLAALVPLPVIVGHVLFGGLLTAVIVTVTHTSEDYTTEMDDSYVETQFKTTRDAVTRDPISEYIWGGMQYQLEHHLFPTMPRYNYHRLVPLVKKFAEENGIGYRATGQWEIMRDNLDLVRLVELDRVGSAPVVADSPNPGSADLSKM